MGRHAEHRRDPRRFQYVNLGCALTTPYLICRCSCVRRAPFRLSIRSSKALAPQSDDGLCIDSPRTCATAAQLLSSPLLIYIPVTNRYVIRLSNTEIIMRAISCLLAFAVLVAYRSVEALSWSQHHQNRRSLQSSDLLEQATLRPATDGRSIPITSPVPLDTSLWGTTSVMGRKLLEVCTRPRWTGMFSRA